MTRTTAGLVRTALTIAWANLVRLSRDRLGLFFIVVLPMLIILLFGVAGESGPSAPVGVVPAGAGPLGGELLDRLRDQDTLEVRIYADRAALETDVRRRIVVAGLVLPPDYDALVRSGEQIAVDLLVDPSGTVPTAVRTTVGGALAQENVRLQTAQFTAAQFALEFDDAVALADAAGEREGPVVRTETAGTASPPARRLDRSAAANLVLFVFITSLVGSAALIETRRLGVSRRMLASPTTAGAILGGEALGRFVIAIVQALIVIVGASLLFGAQWQDPVAVWVVVGLLSLVGTGAAMLFGALLNNAEQASGVAVPLGIGLGMLGGCMWPLEIVPRPLQVIGHFTPHAWAMDALNEILLADAGLRDVGGQLGILAAIAAVLLAAAAWQLGRVLRTATVTS